MTTPSPPVILFDGVCNLCHAGVNFILKRDPQGYFRFAPLQSAAGQRILKNLDLPTETMDTMVLTEGGGASFRSTAALKIARRLTWPWPLLSAFLILPEFLRDSVYGVVSRNRYRWFGKQATCSLPSLGKKGNEERFLDS